MSLTIPRLRISIRHGSRFIFHTLDRTIHRHPLICGLLFPCFQATIADIATQYIIMKYKNNHSQYKCHSHDTIDWKRVGFFSSFGFFYCGGAQYFIYTKIFPRFIDSIITLVKNIFNKLYFYIMCVFNINLILKQKFSGVWTKRCLKVLIDQAIVTPFIYFPSFFFMKECYFHSNDVKAKIGQQLHIYHGIAENPLERKRIKLYIFPSWDDLMVAWKVWTPAQLITFSLRYHWRLPWIAVTSFGFTCVLSIRSRFHTEDDDEEMEPTKMNN